MITDFSAVKSRNLYTQCKRNRGTILKKRFETRSRFGSVGVCKSLCIVVRNRDSRSRTDCFVVTRLLNSEYFGTKSGQKRSKSYRIVVFRSPSGTRRCMSKNTSRPRMIGEKRLEFVVNRRK